MIGTNLPPRGRDALAVLLSSLALTFGAASAEAWGTSNNGVGIFPSSAAASYVQTLPDGNGGVFVLWRDERAGAGNGNVFLQRLTSTGGTASGWPTSAPLAVCNESHDQDEPSMCLDLAGGVFVTWRDRRSASAGDIYVQRITSSGSVASGWTTNGVVVCNATDVQTQPQILPDGTGDAVVIAWIDRRTVGTDGDQIYTQRVAASNGSGSWAYNGAHPSSASHLSTAGFVMTDDGAGGAVFAWHSTSLDLYFQHLNTSGASNWDSGSHDSNVLGETIAREPGSGYHLVYTKDPSGADPGDLLYRRLSLNGGYQSSLLTLSDAAGYQGLAAIVSDGVGGALIGWQDDQAEDPWMDLYMHRVLGDGTLSSCWPTDGKRVVEGADPATRLSMVSDERGGAVIVTPHAELYAYHVLYDGTFDSVFPVDVSVAATVYAPSTVSMGAGRVITAWLDLRGSTFNVYANEATYTAPSYATPPASISSEGFGKTTLLVNWTGPASGSVTGFDVRTAPYAIDDGNFSSAREVVFIPWDGSSGGSFCATALGLLSCTNHTLAVRALGSCGRPSSVVSTSNATRCSGHIEVFCDDGFAGQPSRPDEASPALELRGPWPNPTPGGAALSLVIPSSHAGDEIEIGLYDLSGRRRAILHRGIATAGLHTWTPDPGAVKEPGIFYIRARVGAEVLQKRLVVIR